MTWMAAMLSVVALGAGDGAAPLATSAPAPIFWRQTLFSIPFKVQQAPTAAQQPAEIQLFVSPDRGQTWGDQPWLKASPQKGYFLFRAGNDGEYWFDVRTVDRSGQVRPQGPHNAQLVVVVDTAPPKLQLSAQRGDGGQIIAAFRVDEAYLKADSLAIDYRLAPAAPWQPVSIGPTDIHTTNDVHTGEVHWYPPSGANAIEIRLRASDLAGNSAESHAQLALSPAGAAASAIRFAPGAESGVTISNPRPANGFTTSPYGAPTPPLSVPSGAAALSPASSGNAPASPNGPPARTPWPADNAPSGGVAAMSPAKPGGETAGSVSLRVSPPATNQLVSVRDQASPSGLSAFQASDPTAARAAAGRSAQEPTNTSPPATPAAPTTPAADVGPPPGVPLRWINSRVFQLTYDTRALGAAGNAAVELWGTRDGGKTWQSFGTDTNGKSPMLVTVPEEGIYGFQMLLQGNNDPHAGSPGRPPLPGETPRTWIGVDLTRPTGRITQARQGQGRDADKLILLWDARDNRALAEKPISLSYSERVGGPWNSIAGNLPNTSAYTWQLNAKLPQRIYLRLEIRDAAGNTGVYEAPEPVALETSSPSVPVRDLSPLGWIDSQPGETSYLR